MPSGRMGIDFSAFDLTALEAGEGGRSDGGDGSSRSGAGHSLGAAAAGSGLQCGSSGQAYYGDDDESTIGGVSNLGGDSGDLELQLEAPLLGPELVHPMPAGVSIGVPPDVVAAQLQAVAEAQQLQQQPAGGGSPTPAQVRPTPFYAAVASPALVHGYGTSHPGSMQHAHVHFRSDDHLAMGMNEAIPAADMATAPAAVAAATAAAQPPLPVTVTSCESDLEVSLLPEGRASPAPPARSCMRSPPALRSPAPDGSSNISRPSSRLDRHVSWEDSNGRDS